MLRWLKRIALLLLCIFGILVYREWVLRHEAPLFLPLGFFETSLPLTTPEEDARDPRLWKDPLSPLVVTRDEFDRLTNSTNAVTASGVDILIFGATLGGVAAADSAAEGGSNVLLLSAHEELGREWDIDATLLLDEMRDAPDGTPIERSLRAFLRTRYQIFDKTPYSVPADVTDFLKDRLRSRGIDPLLGYAPAAFTGPSDIVIDRVLLRTNDGSSAIIVPFRYLIDASSTGDAFAWLNVPYAMGWDTIEATGEPNALSTEGAKALAEGYTQSGRTVQGIGHRLDGGSDMIAILDRGYHGTFLHPRIDDATCWGKGDDQDLNLLYEEQRLPFLNGGSYLRAQRTGCRLSFHLTSSFEDTVDLYVVHKGNDAVKGVVYIGAEQLPISIHQSAEPLDTFAHLGAFPVGPNELLSIELFSTLPTDRIEGIIARKRNVGSVYRPIKPDSEGQITLNMRAWSGNLADMYVVMADDQHIPFTLRVGDDSYELLSVGARTWKAQNVPLTFGTSQIASDASGEVAAIAVVPTGPLRRLVASMTGTMDLDGEERSRFPPLADIRPHVWPLHITETGTYLLLTTVQDCGARCGSSIVETGSSLRLSRNHLVGLNRLPITTVALDIVSLKGDQIYSVAFASESRKVPHIDITKMKEDQADLFAAGASAASVKPDQNGIFDIWVKASQTTVATLDIGYEQPREIAVSDDALSYAGTFYITSERGVTVHGGGEVNLVALPNTFIDTFRRHLDPSTEETVIAHISLPAGRMMTWLEGVSPPPLLVLEDSRGNVQQMTFITDGQTARGTETVLQSGVSEISLRIPRHTTPLELVLHESIDTTTTLLSGTESGQIMMLLPPDPLATSGSVREEGLATHSSGYLVLHVSPEGIGPVTPGLLSSPALTTRLQVAAEHALSFLRFSAQTPLCTTDSPSCDPRRFVRDTSIFGTPNAHAKQPRIQDGRRLRGRITLSSSGAYLLRTTCTELCTFACVDLPDENNRCIARTQETAIQDDAVGSVDGVSRLMNMTSPREKALGTIPAFLKLLRSDGLIPQRPTYLEEAPPPRTISLRLGMFLSESGHNILPAHTTISTTHAASRALRTARGQLSIGTTAGYIARFAELRNLPLPDLEDPSNIDDLKLFLTTHGVKLFPLDELSDDPLLRIAFQQEFLRGEGMLTTEWVGNELKYRSVILDSPEELRRRTVEFFGTEGNFTMGDILSHLIPADEFRTLGRTQLVNRGVALGIITEKMLKLLPEEILALKADTELLLKAEVISLRQAFEQEDVD